LGEAAEGTRFVIARAAFLIALLLAATSAHAAEPWIGRWAEDVKYCTTPGESANETPMTFTRTTARWFGTCKVSSIRKQGQIWALKARCPSTPAPLDIHLSMQGEKLKAFWGEAHPQVMVRCP
jgi:hypothetical protein